MEKNSENPDKKTKFVEKSKNTDGKFKQAQKIEIKRKN